MSENIRRALEVHLNAMTPALATAWENVNFTPTVGVPYQRVYVLPANPDNSTQGAGHYMEIGIFQVSLYYPAGGGSATAQARAEMIRSHFKRGATLVNGGIRTIITHTPKKHPAMTEGDRYVVALSIRYQADIFVV